MIKAELLQQILTSMEKEPFSFRTHILLIQCTAHPFTIIYNVIGKFTVYLQERRYKRRDHPTSARKE